MSVVPSIVRAVVLPTLDLSLEIRPPSVLTALGGAVAAYRVTVAGDPDDVFGDLGFATRKGLHYVARVGTGWTRGVDYAVTVAAVGTNAVVSGESVMEAVGASPVTSRAGTVRQRVFELVADAAIGVDGRALTVLADEFGRPQSWAWKEPFGDRVFPVLEVGVAHAEMQEVDDSETELAVVTVPVRVYEASHGIDRGGELVTAVGERVRAVLKGAVAGASDGALGLNGFGVVPGSVSFEMPSRPALSPDGKVVGCDVVVRVPVLFKGTVSLW